MRATTISRHESAVPRTQCGKIFVTIRCSGTSAMQGGYAAGGMEVGKTEDRQVKEIEETQEALRDSIEEAKRLADRAQHLLQQHKKTIEQKSD